MKSRGGKMSKAQGLLLLWYVIPFILLIIIFLGELKNLRNGGRWGGMG
jgi:hypothetical protein